VKQKKQAESFGFDRHFAPDTRQKTGAIALVIIFGWCGGSVGRRIKA
jgi:hypothetical protein